MKKTLSTLIIAIASALTVNTAQADDLLSVYQQALLNDTVVLKAKAQSEIVKEDIIKARAALLPQISAYGSYSDGETESYNEGSVITTEFNSLGYGASLNMQLYHHDTWLGLDIAEKTAHQSDLSYQVSSESHKPILMC